MNITSYDHNYARKVLKHTDEIADFNYLLATNDEVLTEYVDVECSNCGIHHISPQVILNPFGYGTEGAVLLQQRHTCSKCGADSRIVESTYQMLMRVREYNQYQQLSSVV
jgi:hypothetical protein